MSVTAIPSTEHASVLLGIIICYLGNVMRNQFRSKNERYRCVPALRNI